MKKNCEKTRKALPAYLQGHLFTMSRARIERHLAGCVVCRSEYEALRRADETKRILKDINAPVDVVGRMKEGVSSVAKLKKLLYRPLWVAGLAAVIAGLYYYAVTPRQLDIEIEHIVASTPSGTASVTAAAPAHTEATAVKNEGTSRAAVRNKAEKAPPEPDPLVVTFTPEDDTAAVQRINEIMHDYTPLRAAMFSSRRKKVEGKLAAGDLLALLRKVDAVARVSYSRKRFRSFPDESTIPFVLRLRSAPKPAAEPAVAKEPPPKPAVEPARATPAKAAEPPKEAAPAKKEAESVKAAEPAKAAAPAKAAEPSSTSTAPSTSAAP